MTKKKRLFIILGSAIGGYLLIFCLTLTMYHYIQRNPIDAMAIRYLRNESNIEEVYGEAEYIARNISHKSEKTETTLKRCYSVETETQEIIVYVFFEIEGDEYRAVSMEVLEVKENEKPGGRPLA